MIIRNVSGMARLINGVVVRPNRDVIVPKDYVIGDYDEIVVKEEIKSVEVKSDFGGDIDLIKSKHKNKKTMKGE